MIRSIGAIVAGIPVFEGQLGGRVRDERSGVVTLLLAQSALPGET